MSKGKENEPSFTIWEANERPKAPFNLTPFAITLNAPFEKLLPWLPPTDTRLRPDQRAMEEGKYGLAASEKDRLEKQQRLRRREREAKNLPSQGEPRWFKKVPTGWEFTHEYWKVREEVGKQRSEGKDAKWPGVQEIF